MEEVLGVHDGDWQRTKLIRRMFWQPRTDFRESMEPWWNDDYIIAGIMLSGSLLWNPFETIQYHTLSPRLRKIPQLLFMTNHWDEQALLYADESLRNSHDICMHYLLARHTVHYECLPSKFKENRNFNVELILKRPEYFQRLSYTFRNDKEIALLLIPYWGAELEYVSDRLQDDDELVSIAADTPHGWIHLRYASERLQNDPRFQLKIAEGRAQEAKEEAQIKAEIEQM